MPMTYIQIDITGLEVIFSSIMGILVFCWVARKIVKIINRA